MSRGRNGMSFPLLRVSLLILLVGGLAATTFASSGRRSLAFTSGGSSDLALTGTDIPDPVMPDGVVTYTFTITNNGPSDSAGNFSGQVCVGGCAGKVAPRRNLTSTEATLIDISGTGSWDCSGNLPGTMSQFSFNCSTPFIAANTTETIVMHLQAPSIETVIFTSGSVYPSGNSETDFSNNFVNMNTTVTSQSDISVAATDKPDPVEPSGVVTYTIAINNSGPDPADVTAYDRFCSGAGCSQRQASKNARPPRINATDPTFISASGTGWSCSFDGFNQITCSTTSPIAANSTSFVTVQLQAPPEETVIENQISAFPTFTDPNFSNNSVLETTTVANPCPPVFTDFSPANGSTGEPTSGTLTWTSSQADLYQVFLGVVGRGCSTLYGSTTAPQLDYSGLLPATQYEYRIEAQLNSCGSIGTTDCILFTTGGSACGTTAPTLLAPVTGTTVPSPVTFSWSSVPGATGYIFTVVTFGRNDSILLNKSTTTAVRTLSPGPHEWFVEATSDSCPNIVSSRASFAVSDPVAICAAPPKTIASIVGESTSGETYHFLWEGVPTLTTYEAQEATDPNFTDAKTTTTTALSVEYRHEATEPTPYYYRVRAICGRNAAEYSKVIRTVVIPKPDPNSKLFELTTEDGNNPPIQFSIFIPIPPGTTKTLGSPFNFGTSAPWLTVGPGPVSPSGLSLAAAVNPSTLPVGTSTATLTVTSVSSGMTIASPTVSLTLATPITPAGKSAPPDNALLIPAVANVQGQKSKWQSDIRMTNLSSKKLMYQLTYTPSTVDTLADSKITQFEVTSGQTVALDDIVKHLYGLGSLADGTNGVLEFHPLNFAGKFLPVRFNLSTFASSRTYNLAEDGSVGQFIPAIPYSKFIGATALNSTATPRLSIQAISQNDNYRTNLGILEGSGQPADVSVKVFNDNGGLVKQFFVSLKAGEHQQLNSVLATQKVTLDDGRFELQITSGAGRIMAYASVVDSRSNDPQLVPAVDISNLKASTYILAGITDFTSQFTKFRSDVRIFNAGSTAVDAKLTLYPESGSPVVRNVTIGAGKIAAFDNIVSSLFGLSNAGGSLHIDTASDSSLVVTGRTYDLRETGTVGQFIPAVTLDEAVSKSDRALQILQVEQSARFRTNVGVAEVAGKSVTVEVTADIPDSLVSPVITLQLQPNEFKQLNSVLKMMGLDNQFNVRMSVKVISGDGKVTAYGSVVDNKSEDPTYVPAQ
ncbi:MAG TPA: hypothetical protein VHL58_01090 [Thermoanaerobaculia bacterium]|nr:hypothetical protein [Thermoanaerobaculia bacterium]